MSKRTKTQQKPEITLLNLVNYRNYIFTWFSEIAIKLCTGRNLDELNANNIQGIVAEVGNCINNEIEILRKRNIDPCELRPIPITGTDPRDKIGLCYAFKTLNDLSMGISRGALSLPTSISLEFAEYTRSFMGAGRKKREIFIIDESVLAMSVIGAYLSQSYAIGGEYGYTYVEVIPYLLALDRIRKINSRAKRIVGMVQRNEGSVNVVLLGMATVIAITVREMLRDIVKRDGHAIANYLRITRTGNKIIVKGFDSIDLIQLVKIIVRGGIAGALYAILSRYPPKQFNSLRRFIEVTAINLLKFQSFRKANYIYDILRYLRSDELNKEGIIWYKKEAEKILEWSEIVSRFSRLSKLVV